MPINQHRQVERQTDRQTDRQTERAMNADRQKSTEDTQKKQIQNNKDLLTENKNK